MVSVYKRISPLSQQQPIVNPDGTPSLYFMRQWLQQRTATLSAGDVEALVNELLARKINTADPITGGGDLSADLTIGHADSGVSPGAYGDGSNIPAVTVDADGHITGVTEVPVAAGSGISAADAHVIALQRDWIDL